MSAEAWDNLYGSNAWVTLALDSPGPVRSVEDALDAIRGAHADEVETLRDEIRHLRAWINDECPACGGPLAYDASRGRDSSPT